MKVLIITHRPNTEQLCSDLVIRTVEESELVDKLVSIMGNENLPFVNIVCRRIEDYNFGTVGQRFGSACGPQSIYTPGLPGWGDDLRIQVSAKIQARNKRKNTLTEIRAEIEKDVKEKYERKLQKLLKKLSEGEE